LNEENAVTLFLASEFLAATWIDAAGM